MIKHKNHVVISNELALDMLKEIFRRISLRQASPIPRFLCDTYDISITSAKLFVGAMFDLKIVAFKGETTKSFYLFGKLNWLETPPTIEMAKLVLEQKHETANERVRAQRAFSAGMKVYKEAKKEIPEEPVVVPEVVEKEAVIETPKEEVNIDIVPVVGPNPDTSSYSIDNFSDKELVAELRRRGYTVTASKTVTIEL